MGDAIDPCGTVGKAHIQKGQRFDDSPWSMSRLVLGRHMTGTRGEGASGTNAMGHDTSSAVYVVILVQENASSTKMLE